jgi:hypothetical protein
MAAREDIQIRFEDNLNRVKNLVGIYTSRSGKGKGRRPTQDSDILRAADVLLHATLEDLLRSLAEWKLPSANPDVFVEIPLSGLKRGERFGLQQLAAFRGRTVDEVFAKSVTEYLEKSTYNHPGDVKILLVSIGVALEIDNAERIELAALMSRRHWIAHRLDRNPYRGSGHHSVKSLSTATVSLWIEAVQRLGRNILSKV